MEEALRKYMKEHGIVCSKYICEGCEEFEVDLLLKLSELIDR